MRQKILTVLRNSNGDYCSLTVRVVQSPSSSTIIRLSLVALYFYHFMRYVLCLEHLALYFLGLFFFICCSKKLDPNLLFYVGEKHAPLELELLIGFACLFLLAVSCSFYFLSCCLFSCSALVFLELVFCLRLNFL